MSFFTHIGISISRQNLESGRRVTQGKPGPLCYYINPAVPSLASSTSIIPRSTVERGFLVKFDCIRYNIKNKREVVL